MLLAPHFACPSAPVCFSTWSPVGPLRSVPPWRRIAPAFEGGVLLTAYCVTFASGRGLGMVSPARTRPAGRAGSYGFF